MPEISSGIGDGLHCLDGAVAIEKGDEDRAAVIGGTTASCADGDVLHAVAVEITEGGDGVAEELTGGKRDTGSGQSADGGGDLRGVFDRAISVHEENVNGTCIGGTVIVGSCADEEVRHAIEIEVAEGIEVAAKAVGIVEQAGERGFGRVDDVKAADGGAGLSVEQGGRGQ